MGMGNLTPSELFLRVRVRLGIVGADRDDLDVQRFQCAISSLPKS